MLKKINLYIALIFLIPLVLSLIWFKEGRIMAGGEPGLLFHNPERKFELTHLSWSEIGLGSALRNGVTSAPTYWVFAKIDQFLPDYLVQALYFYYLFTVSGISIYFLIKLIFPKIEPKLLFVAVAFYWFNPYSLVNIWNRFLYDFMSLWAFLPLTALLFVYGLKNQKILFAVLLSLSTVIFSFGLSNIAFLMLFGLNLFFFFIFYFFLMDQKKFTIYYSLIFFITFVLFNSWWIIHAIFFRASSYYDTYLTGFFSASGNLDTLNILSEQLSSILYSLRLMHGTFFTEGPIWARFFESFPFSLLTYLPTLLIIWVVVKFRKNREVIFLSLFIVFLLLLIKGTANPLGEIFVFFFTNFPILQVFRNPFEKFGVLLPLCFSPLIAFGLYKLNFLFANKNQSIFYSLITIYVVLISFPFWTGLVFTRKDLENEQFLQSYRTQVPTYYKEANDWLKKDQDLFRLMVFPIGGEGINQIWGIPYSGIESSNLLFNKPSISFNTSIPFYSEIISSLDRLLFEREDFAKVASILNVKYLLLRKDSDWQKDNMRDPSDLEKLFQDRKYQKVAQFDELFFYEIDQNYFRPKIWASTNLVRVDGKTDIEDFFLSNPKAGAVIYSKDDNLDSTKKVLIKPQKSSFFSEIKKYSLKEAFDSLPSAKYLPDNPIYPFIQLKENLEKMENKDTSGKFLYDLSRLGKKAAEIYLLAQQGKSNYLEKGLDNYLTLLSGFENEFGEKTKLSPQNRFSNLLFNSLISQKIVITEAINSLPVQSKKHYQSSLDNLLLEMGLLFDSFLHISDQKDFWIHRFNIVDSGNYQLVLKNSQTPFLLNGISYLKPDIFFLEKGYHELVIFNSDTNPLFLKTIAKTKQAIPEITFEKINPTEYRVKIKDAKNPFLLVFSELYSSGWQLLLDGKPVDEAKHLMINSYANGWFLEEISNFEGTIKYIPQDFINMGNKISLVSISLGILIILICKKAFFKF